jgi:type IV secretion system protein VirD4
LETPDELLTFLTEATRDGIWNRLLYRGAAWALMRKDGVLPDGAPRIGATIETDLTEHGFSVLRAALALKEKSGPSDLSSRGFERAANAFEAVVRNGDPADPKRGFHRTVAAAAYHLAEADKTLAGVANFLSDPRRPIETTLRAMMTTPHLGEAGVHPVVASSARELLNKSDNERSGVLSTAMSFLGLYRDPVVAAVTRRCDWRIHDLVEGKTATTLYLVVPPSDISRTKPLVRLILNQIGRRLTEELEAKKHRRRLLLMLDEFPALGRLDFFESALAFMAGYGLKSFLIAQSLNQIEKAYGQNNSILDNCHVRVSFATNDERTAKRVSDALGTATEMRAMKNYAGHRLSPWLGHLMVSRQETARPLLTPGEVMQLPPADELILVSGCHPIRAKKVRYFEDPEMKGRILPPPALTSPSPPLV